ncbi:MAG: pyridoxamine 5'-phosphate oxidase [Elusimicrobia bacterium]|nr:pyridoxamine 5'-phosphate oxidase [Elusimicrobiota bacterium]
MIRPGTFQCGPDPLRQFDEWAARARRAGIETPNAMALATVGRVGAPSVRMVLFQGWLRGGLTFFTNYRSRKARELAASPRAACVVYWDELGRQIRLEGRVVRLTRSESAAYFAKRPRGSQLSAWVSPQSEVLAEGASWSGRRRLLKERARVERRFTGKPVPCPPFWGGYALVPRRIEFWQAAPNRLHCRMAYLRGRVGWTVRELAP